MENGISKAFETVQVQNRPVVARNTNLTVGLDDLDIPVSGKPLDPTVCCCISTYVNERPNKYPFNSHREGDVYFHNVKFLKMTICFNSCFTTEVETEAIVTQASNGIIVPNINVHDLLNRRKYELVKSEKCTQKHHDLNRFTGIGWYMYFCCTVPGIMSTLRKVFCLQECESRINIGTLACERTLYRAVIN